ncbi:hypothetical protein ABZ805_17930 [Saccharopolyspora sp. NPDC047091]|uniref:hypothetical protein n=1 Tax=Saccharopolyspora sp. NPDC047091 TaxID=3155924 RepID=UPI0033F6AAF4
MSAPPFILAYSAQAQKVIEDLQRPRHKEKWTKVRKTLRLLRDIGPSHPGLQSHKYHSITGPDGEGVWESYVENHTPGAWRIWWTYGPGVDELTIITVGPHP